MKSHLVIFAWIVSAAGAAADTSLKDMIGEASKCSDILLQNLASQTCDSPEQIAAVAVAKCQDKWNAVASKAVSPSPAAGSSNERLRSLNTFSQAMENEYIRSAELRAINMRTAAGRCGFE